MTPIMSTAPPPLKIELLLSQLDSLRSPGAIVARILAASEDERRLADVIASDAALLQRVLAILERGDDGDFPESTNLEDAIERLGAKTVCCSAIVVQIIGVFSEDPQAAMEGLNRAEFWKHALAVGCAARQAAVLMAGALHPEEALAIGLLHDVGKIALQTVMPKSYGRVIREADRKREDITEVERSQLGVDHTLVGHRLAEQWGLPQAWVECIWLHHQAPGALPASVGAGRHVQIIQFADTLVRELGIGYSGNHQIHYSSKDLARELGLSEEQRREIVETLPAETESRAIWIREASGRSADARVRPLYRAEELSTQNETLGEENRRLHRNAEWFAALAWLNGRISPRSSVREVCAASAEALRRALGMSSVVLFVPAADGRCIEVGFSDGAPATEVIEWSGSHPSRMQETIDSARMSATGIWVTPLPRALQPCVDAHRGRLGGGPLWMMPIVCRQQWLGGACFAVEPGQITAIQGEAEELGAVSASIGLAIAQASAQTEMRALSDELADINRRWSAMQSEVLRMHALESVVAMATGAAHELNNPLAVISGRAQMLRDAAESNEQRAALDAIIGQAHAASDIVTELMEFAEPSASSPEQIDLGDLLGQFREQLASEGVLPTSDLALETAADTPPVWFDRGRLTRVFRELVDNAMEASAPERRVLSIKVFPDLTEEIAVVIVADRGRGMTPEVLNHAMDPFFSSRPAGRGRGLGLARVARWLASDGGSIRIESISGVGTQVELRFPTSRRVGS